MTSICHSWTFNPTEAIELQKKLASQLILKDDFKIGMRRDFAVYEELAKRIPKILSF